MADNEIIIGENTDINISSEKIQGLIYIVRGKQVMLDSDLARLYQVETKVFNQAVKRNIKRFPESFRFQITEEEYNSLRSQFVTSKGGRRYLPYVFTEQGIAMLSAVLRSDIAIQVSIRIMETFVEMRRYMANNELLYKKVNDLETHLIESDIQHKAFEQKTDERFKEVFDYIAQHQESSQKIFFDGQIFDAFSLLAEIVSQANKSIILIDGYVDIGTLNILSKKKKAVDVCIYTFSNTKLSAQDITNFNAQYPKLEVRYTRAFHDRFLILDNTKAYHIGASLKDAGKKCFGINKIEDSGVIRDIMQRVQLKSQ